MIPEFLKNFTKKFFPYLSITLYLLDFLNQRELLKPEAERVFFSPGILYRA